MSWQKRKVMVEREEEVLTCDECGEQELTRRNGELRRWARLQSLATDTPPVVDKDYCPACLARLVVAK